MRRGTAVALAVVAVLSIAANLILMSQRGQYDCAIDDVMPAVRTGRQQNVTGAVPYKEFRNGVLRRAAAGYHIWSTKYKVRGVTHIIMKSHLRFYFFRFDEFIQN